MESDSKPRDKMYHIETTNKVLSKLQTSIKPNIYEQQDKQ